MSLEQLQNYRKEAAQRLFNNGHVEKATDDYYIVKSETSEGYVYVVNVVHEKHYVCSCPDYEKRSKNLKCKHELATELFIENNNQDEK